MMTHAIYIYFIINAFIAGKSDEGVRFMIIYFLFGIPYLLTVILIAVSKGLFSLLKRKTWIVQFYRLWFTDYYKDKQLDIKVVSKRLKEGDYWELKFLRKLLTKYNHTTKQP